MPNIAVTTLHGRADHATRGGPAPQRHHRKRGLTGVGAVQVEMP